MNYISWQSALKQEKELVVLMYGDMKVPSEITSCLGYDVSSDLNLSFAKKNVVITMGKLPMKRIVFIGLGDKSQITRHKYRCLIGEVVRKEECNLCIFIDGAVCDMIPLETASYDAAYMSLYSSYDYNKKNERELSISSMLDVSCVIEEAVIAADCVNHARHYGNMPVNLLTSETFAQEAAELADKLGVKYEILGNDELAEIGAGAILAVNRGSIHEAKLITLWYNGNGEDVYTALVGKGIMYDSGGYCLKSKTSMHGMKYDMCGGANVLGAFEMIVRQKRKVNVVAVIACAENKIGSHSYLCDEVLTSLSGKTIEVTNTDAEGRLVLCDALTYIQKDHRVKRVVDIATLTGACMTALGCEYTGAFTNSKVFLDELIIASKKSDEKIWELPVDDSFHQQMRDSQVADLVNAVNKAYGGASLAAAFLEEFINAGVEWIHLDIAGCSSISKGNCYCCAGATGGMVATLGYLFKK